QLVGRPEAGVSCRQPPSRNSWVSAAVHRETERRLSTPDSIPDSLLTKPSVVVNRALEPCAKVHLRFVLQNATGQCDVGHAIANVSHARWREPWFDGGSQQFIERCNER